jgi:hypothetical protein
MRVIECIGYRYDDCERLIGRHPSWVAITNELCSIGAVDVVHRYPQLIVVLASVMHPNDVRMEQRRRQVCFPEESLTELDVGAQALSLNPWISDVVPSRG